MQELRTRGVRYDAARQMLAHRLAHAILLQMEAAGDSPDDRVKDAVARSSAVKTYAGQVWPALDPKAVLFSLLANASVLESHAGDLLTDQERSVLLWANPAAGRGSARWSTADTVLLDEINDHLQRTPAWATSSSTKPRTCHRCSCGPSGDDARPVRRRCWATWRRGRRAGSRGAGVGAGEPRPPRDRVRRRRGTVRTRRQFRPRDPHASPARSASLPRTQP